MNSTDGFSSQTLLLVVPFVLVIAAVVLVGCPGPPQGGEPVEETWDDICDHVSTDDLGHAELPLDVYCDLTEHRTCPADLDAFEAGFESCALAEIDWPRCAWRRDEGCGVVRFEEPNDESSYYGIWFNDDGSLRGVETGSDAGSFCGTRSAGFTAGETGPAMESWRDDPCPEVQTTWCCNPE